MFRLAIVMITLIPITANAETLNLIDRDANTATVHIARFNSGKADTVNLFEIGTQIYCRDEEDFEGGTNCALIQFETHSNYRNNFNTTLNVDAVRYGKARIGGLHIAVKDRSNLAANEAQGIVVAETSLNVIGPEDYSSSILGKRQGIRFNARGNGETGVGFAAITGARHPEAVLNTGFYVGELRAGKINYGFRCDISGVCFTVEGNPKLAMQLNGSDIELRPGVRLNTELLRLRNEILRLKMQVRRLQR